MYTKDIDNLSPQRRWYILGILGVGHAAISSTKYIAVMYYVVMQAALGFSDVQMGKLGAMMGLTVFSYLFGGLLSDIFKSKTMCVTAMMIGTVCCGIMLTLPSFEVLLVLVALCGQASSLVNFIPETKIIHQVFPKEQEGRAYGMHFSFMAITTMIIGFAMSAIIAGADAMAGYRFLLVAHMALCFIPGILLFFAFKEPKKVKGEVDPNRFQFKYVIDVLKIPAVWVVVLVGFGIYLSYLAMSYMVPLLTKSFGVTVAVAALIGTIRSSVIRMFLSPASGILTDKLKSATKVNLYCLYAFAVCLIAAIFMPFDSSMVVLAVALVLLIAAIYAASSSCWFTPLTEIGIPDKMRGTASGIVCALAFSSDLFGYVISGNLIEKYGELGYRYVFGLCLIFTVVSIVSAYVLLRIVKKNKEIEATEMLKGA